MTLPVPAGDVPEVVIGDAVPDQSMRRALQKDLVATQRVVDSLVERVKALEAEKPKWEYEQFALQCIVAYMGSAGPNAGSRIKFFHDWVPMAWSEFQKCLAANPAEKPAPIAEIVGIA